MSPTPQDLMGVVIEPSEVTADRRLEEERVVVSGMAGLYPKSRNVKEFSDVLYNKVNPVTSEDYRWEYKHPEISDYSGKVSGLDLFDAQFFKVHHHQANMMDPMSRKLLELAYEAIYDAGINPKEFNGKKVGVFIAAGISESENDGFFDTTSKGGFGVTGCVKLAADGKTKSFAENADGFAKSDAINVLFLQKSRDALRVYGEVVHVKNEFLSMISDKTGQVFGYNRELNSYTSFLKQFYSEVDVAPNAVEYLEGFGSASPEADKTELQAINNVFCGNRSDPLLVGSVLSNVGYTESASGFTAMTKVLLGYHKGEIAANLHCDSPRQDVVGLREGKMQIVTDHKTIHSTYTAVNGLSITGVNSHVLLNGQYKRKDASRYKSTIPRLVTVSTRTDDTLPKIFQDLKSRPVDPEEIGLFHKIHGDDISGHLGRGYIILDSTDDQNTVCLGEQTAYVNDAERPLWFVYSGMGSQWTAMGTHLMRIPIFAAAVQRCHKVLEPFGIDIVDIITSDNETLLKNIQNTFVAIAVIQIGLTDVMKELGFVPDKIIGHSVGELGCAYADGCLSAEEMLMSAYYRGRASVETKFIRGAMAAVGLGYQQISKMCPPEIEVACHNGPESCTISGPADKMTEFVSQLTTNGIFAKEVPSSNIAYHSRYIADAGPVLYESLSKILTHPKTRSDKWISTSVPQERWHQPSAKVCSAEYLTNNLLSPVLFEEASHLIPNNAVLVEIAPHGLLQAILKRSLPETCKNIAITRRGHPDNAVFLLNAIGQLYIEGFTPKLEVLYPKIEFPVSTGTPHLSHHVEWMHAEQWNVLAHMKTMIRKAASCDYLINLHNVEHSYLQGHVIRGKVLYPFAAALVASWDTLAMSLKLLKKHISVQFRDLHLYSQPILHARKQLKLSVNLHRGTGLFDVLDGCSKVLSGYISTIDESADVSVQSQTHLNIDSEEVYQNLCSRGYGYRDDFRSIDKVNETITEAELKWDNNWVTLIDGMLQLNTLRHNYSGVAQPYQIRELTIDVMQHVELCSDTRILKAAVDPIYDSTSCGGVVMRNIYFRNVAIDSPERITLDLLVPATGTKNGSKPSSATNKYEDEQRLSLEISNVGDINTLNWKNVGNVLNTGIKVKVQYAGLNVADIKRASGVLPFEDDTTSFGMEFSGLTESGNRVMGLLKSGAVSTVVAARFDLLWPVPAHWSLEDAATVPLAYAQAFYCLRMKNKLVKNSRVLIHGGAGALGQAAISIALAMGCQIFTTVADQAKKRFLLKLFPQLKEEYIGNSRDSSFADVVLNATNSIGCDIILSCVKSDLRNECLKCTASYGTTVDTSLLISRDDFVYGMSYMTQCRSFMAVDFKSVFDNNQSDLKQIQELISEGISQGYVRPLSRVTYAPSEAPRAFRLLAASRHRGRVLLRLRDQPLAKPTLSCTQELCHVIFSDDDLASLQVADRLVARGANKLRIHCFNPSSTHALKVRFWENQGVKAHVSFGKLLSSDISKLINECEQIEGIYVLASNKDSDFKEIKSIVDEVTKAAKVSPQQLKYFAVASIDSSIGKEALSKSIDGLSKTIIIPELVKVNKEYNLSIDAPTWNRILMDAVERSLISDHSVLIANPNLLQQISLLQQLGSIAGIGNLYRYGDDTTLKDLSIENEELNMIKLYLQDTYNVTLEDEEISELTKNKIRQIELSAVGEDYKNVKGLSCFFSYVDLDELRGTADFILMDTLVCSVIGNEMDLNQKYLTIVTGLEGHHDRFRSICESLKLQAVVLQPGLDYPKETARELAQRYAKVLLNKLGVKDSFYLLGYEYGVAVALELAAILETNGKRGTVFLFGDTPNGIRTQIEEQLADYSTESELQAQIISHMFKLMSVEDTTLLDNAMKDCSNWDEYISTCMRLLVGRVSHSAQYARAIIDAAYSRITTARSYQFTPQKIKSKIVLMRAKSSTIEDANLHQFSEQPVEVHELDAPLAHATKDLRCAAIINKYLSKDILKSFENSNQCVTYVMS